MHILLKIAPKEIFDAYNLTAITENQGWIHMHIEKGRYDLKQAGIITNQDLVEHVYPFGYHPVHHTPGLWVHDNRNTIFIFVVDNVFVQYSSTEDSDIF